MGLPFLQGKCNTYLPDDSTFNRLVYVVKSLTNAGFYVLLVRPVMNTASSAAELSTYSLQVLTGMAGYPYACAGQSVQPGQHCSGGHQQLGSELGETHHGCQRRRG